MTRMSKSKSKSLSKMAKGQQYSVEVAGAEERAGEGKPRRNIHYPDALLARFDDSVATLYDCFNKGVEAAGDGACFGKRVIVNGVAGPFSWQSYNEVKELRDHVGAALVKHDVPQKACIGLYSINRPEWVIAEHSIYRNKGITIPLYDTLGDEAIEHIVNQTEMAVCFATADKASNLVRIHTKINKLKLIIIMDNEIPSELAAKAKEAGIELIGMDTFVETGKANPCDATPPTAEDVCSICYTSGTTGLPKGVVMKHSTIVADLSAIVQGGIDGLGPKFDINDVHISYLPLAHVFERTVMSVVLTTGMKAGFFQGDTLKLLEDIAELKPTFFPSVPRLFNRIYDKINAGVAAKGGIAAFLFKMAYNSKKSGLASGSVTHWLWDAIVFGAVRARLGGKVKYMITGSAPITADVMDFLRIAFGCEVYEGYGQTETAAGATLTMRGDYDSGHVGVPIACNEVKLVDIPEMNYTSKDEPYPRGEICFRGHNCFTEYYKLPEKTAETIDADGWVHSGDVGLWDDKGRIRIIDRKKNIFKLAQGEYVAPEKIENIIQKHPLIAQAYVHGDSLQSCLVSVLVPDIETIKPWAIEKGFLAAADAESATLTTICGKDDIKATLVKELGTFGRANGLKGFEICKAAFLHDELCSVENDLLTPSFKLKRFEARKVFSDQIAAMYASLA